MHQAHSISRLIALSALVLALEGCFSRAMVPPNMASVMTTSATLADEESSLALNVGGHVAVFGPSVLSVDGRFGHALTDDLQLDLAGSGYAFLGSDPRDQHRGVYSGRVGLKYRLHPGVALIGGLGGGFSPVGGGFVGADVGVVFAFENPYIVPYWALRAFGGVPVLPSVVQGEDGSAAPAETIGGTFETGIRIPMPPSRRVSLFTSFGGTVLYDGRGGVAGESANALWLFSITGGIEVRLGTTDAVSAQASPEPQNLASDE